MKMPGYPRQDSSSRDNAVTMLSSKLTRCCRELTELAEPGKAMPSSERIPQTMTTAATLTAGYRPTPCTWVSGRLCRVVSEFPLNLTLLRLPYPSMFQRSPSPASPYHSTAQVYSNQDLWPSEKAYPFPGSFSALESPLGHGQADADSSVNGDDAAYTGSPTYHASELPVASTSRVVTHSQPLQSQPWWVRESRRNASPAALKASIPRYSTASSSVNIASASNDADVDRQRPQREGAADAFASNYHTAVDVATDVFQAASDRLGMRRAPIRLKTTLSAREKALWTWTNVVNVDTFLQEVRMSKRCPLMIQVLLYRPPKYNPVNRYTPTMLAKVSGRSLCLAW